MRPEDGKNLLQSAIQPVNRDMRDWKGKDRQNQIKMQSCKRPFLDVEYAGKYVMVDQLCEHGAGDGFGEDHREQKPVEQNIHIPPAHSTVLNDPGFDDEMTQKALMLQPP